MHSLRPHRSRGLRIVLLAVVAAAPAGSGFAAWVQLGSGGIGGGQVEGMDGQASQVSGAVKAILPHPTNPDVLSIGAVNGGVWKTTNATSSSPSWTALGDGLSSLSIGAMAFDVADPLRSTILAGFGRFGSLARNDGGTTFTQITTGSGVGLPQGVSWGVAMNPLDADDLVTAIALGPGSSGIYRSQDGGASWERSAMPQSMPRSPRTRAT